MSTSLRDLMAQHADQAGEPVLDAERLVWLGERRLRQRRLGAALSGAVAVVVAVALGISLQPSDPVESPRDPVEQPTQKEQSQQPVRRIVYGDGGTGPGPRYFGSTIHYGSTPVRTGNTYVHVDVTDFGFAYTSDYGRVLFSDGRDIEQIGSHACTRSSDGFVRSYPQAVVSGNAGSLLAWFECRHPELPVLVVYDTGSEAVGGDRRTIARQVVRECGGIGGVPPDDFCDLVGFSGDHLYWRHANYDGRRPREELLRYDVSTGRRTTVPQSEHLLDLRSNARGLVVGRTWEDGTPTDGIGRELQVVGRRLVPRHDETNGDPGAAPGRSTRAFDTGTGEPLALRLPPGYRGAREFTLFQWLEDDVVALGAGVNTHGFDVPEGHVGDILRCHLGTGRCDLAVRGTPRQVRIVQRLGLPG